MLRSLNSSSIFSSKLGFLSINRASLRKGDHTPHALVVLRKDRLENCEVKVDQFEDILVEDLHEVGNFEVLDYI